MGKALKLLALCVIATSLVECRFLPRPQQTVASKRTEASILTADGEKVPIEIKGKDTKKLSPKIGILGIQVEEDEKDKDTKDEKDPNNEQEKKPLESGEDKLNKMQMGYHVPGNVVVEGEAGGFPMYPQQQVGYPMGGYQQQQQPYGYGYFYGKK